MTRSVSRVTAALSIASSVSQFSFLVGCRGMISRGFSFVAFFVCVRASSFCIHLSCLVCSLSVVRGEWICLFCSHRRCSLPEVLDVKSYSLHCRLYFYLFVKFILPFFFTFVCNILFLTYDKYSQCYLVFVFSFQLTSSFLLPVFSAANVVQKSVATDTSLS